jgi:hypothetical protein
MWPRPAIPHGFAGLIDIIVGKEMPVINEQRLAEAQALDRAYADAELFDAARSASEEQKLDAYGHLTWTLGNSDWMACFDAIRVGDDILYHVVVDCESGGFIDTVEKGVLPVSEAKGLINLPSEYIDAGMENHLSARRQKYPTGRFGYRDCEKRWARHIKQLIQQEPELEPEDEMGDLRKAALNRGQP